MGPGATGTAEGGQHRGLGFPAGVQIALALHLPPVVLRDRVVSCGRGGALLFVPGVSAALRWGRGGERGDALTSCPFAPSRWWLRAGAASRLASTKSFVILRSRTRNRLQASLVDVCLKLRRTAPPL